MGAVSNIDKDVVDDDCSEVSREERHHKRLGRALAKKLCRDIIVYEIFHPFVYVDTQNRHKMFEFFGYFSKDENRKIYLLYTNFGNVSDIKMIPCRQTRMIRNLRYNRFDSRIFTLFSSRFNNMEYLSLSLVKDIDIDVVTNVNKMKKLRILRLYCGKESDNYGRRMSSHRQKKSYELEKHFIELPNLREIYVFGFKSEDNNPHHYLNKVFQVSPNLVKFTISPCNPTETPSIYANKFKISQQLLLEICRCKRLEKLTLFYYDMGYDDLNTILQAGSWEKSRMQIHINFHKSFSTKEMNLIMKLRAEYPFSKVIIPNE